MAKKFESDEERKAYNRQKMAESRARQKERIAADPEYAAEIKTQRREAAHKRRADPRQNALIKETQKRRHAERVKNDPEYVERKREVGRNFYWNNREQRLAANQQWYVVNDRSEYNLEWSRANPDKRAESRRRRKALLKGATDIETFSKKDVWERDNGRCGICLEMADENNWHLDHVIPLSKGGQHTFSNVQVSHPKCNLSKKDKILLIE